MFSMRLTLLLSLSFMAQATAEEDQCPHVQHYLSYFHSDTVCDREAQHHFRSQQRARTYRGLLATGVAAVPNQQTVFCPTEVEALYSPEQQNGFATAWIVKNTASTPVAVSYLQQRSDGTAVEVSAFNTKVSPPHHDASSILQPGEFKSIMTFDGHVFHVREVLKDGSLGHVLMQHRVGMTPIRNKFGHVLDCDPSEPDPEPFVEVKGQATSPETERKKPNFVPRRCNALDVGFRNEVGCPLNVYYTGMYEPDLSPIPEDATQAVTPKSCHEKFKFHLGNNPLPPDFMWDWSSQTKFESTLVGHSFLFRLAKDENIVVDSVTLAPSMVIDCPRLSGQKNDVSLTEANSLDVMSGIRESEIALNPFGNKFMNLAATVNASEWMSSYNTTSSPTSFQIPSNPMVGIGSPVVSF